MGSSLKDVLTPFQERILKAFSPENPAFFLTGGAALAAFYLYHRRSEDLDFFTVDDAAFSGSAPAMETLCRRGGFKLEWVRTAPHFRRAVVSGSEGTLVVDLVRDIDRQIVSKKPSRDGVIVDSLEDIAANKLCALIGRQEPKDYLDLYFLAESGLDLISIVPLAQSKDGGVNAAILAQMASEVAMPEIPKYVLRPVTRERLLEFYKELSCRLARTAFPGG